jgi:hypothetical protein
VWWLRPLLYYGEYTFDCRLKKFHEMLLTTLAQTIMTSYEDFQFTLISAPKDDIIRGLMTRAIWKRPCINLFITYFARADNMLLPRRQITCRKSLLSELVQYSCFESFHIPSKKIIFFCQTTWFWWNVRHWTSGVNIHNITGQPWTWSHGSWIYDCLCNQCPWILLLWVRIPFKRGVLDATLCEKACRWFAVGRWFSPCTPGCSNNKTDNHAYCVIHSISSFTQQSTGRYIGNIILDTANQFFILFINTACLNSDRAALSIV